MNEETRQALQAAVNAAYADSPRIGRRVRIIDGRKHLGKTGVVVWHGPDRYSDAGRYDASWMSAAMREASGVYGYRIGVQTDDGSRFFVPADYAEVLG